jgi:hypothetical protein
MLDGIGMTIPLKEDFQDTGYPYTTTATCALGAAQYGYAVANNYGTYDLPRDFFDTQFNIDRKYLDTYNSTISEDNDQHGRDYAVSRLKEMINDSE